MPTCICGKCSAIPNTRSTSRIDRTLGSNAYRQHPGKLPGTPDCLSSSRANTTRRGWYRSGKWWMKLRPDEPVPPELKIDFALNPPWFFLPVSQV
jgi:hypothetical protein